MKREIKFRAKDKRSGEWCIGELHLASKVPHIHPDVLSRIPIVPDTVGQYTGLKDKNGKDIYEGDILRVRDLVQDYDYSDEFWRVGFIKFVSGKFALVNSTNYATSDLTIKHDYSPCKTAQCTYSKYRSEIIGNIYDNPELLTEKREI